ncbi:MAG TPA: hypothetical protein VHE35_33405 [Kofleriaceae bacterium]|nr:hypothetical protein [Kofleriaceae bacterium]
MGAPALPARAWLAAAVAAALAACGPVGYLSQVTRSASTAVDEARVLNAAKYSPYWWTRAVEYLHQARVKAASADFQAANRFGRLATAAAHQAKADSVRRAADPRTMDEITPPPPGPSRGENGTAPALDDDETPAPLAPARGDDGAAP